MSSLCCYCFKWSTSSPPKLKHQELEFKVFFVARGPDVPTVQLIRCSQEKNRRLDLSSRFLLSHSLSQVVFSVFIFRRCHMQVDRQSPGRLFVFLSDADLACTGQTWAKVPAVAFWSPLWQRRSNSYMQMALLCVLCVPQSLLLDNKDPLVPWRKWSYPLQVPDIIVSQAAAAWMNLSKCLINYTYVCGTHHAEELLGMVWKIYLIISLLCDLDFQLHLL